MAAPPDAKRGATYEDLERVPDTMVAEIVDGELFASPRPRPRHAVAASALGGDLNPPFQQGRGGPGGRWNLLTTHRGDEVVRAEPFQAVEVDLLGLWGELREGR